MPQLPDQTHNAILIVPGKGGTAVVGTLRSNMVPQPVKQPNGKGGFEICKSFEGVLEAVQDFLPDVAPDETVTTIGSTIESDAD